MRTVLVAIIAGAIVATALVLMLVPVAPTKDYSLSVDALKDKQSLFTNARVLVTNNGKLPLTNVSISYGNKTEPAISILNPGEQRTFSPPDGVQLDSVTVSADHGIRIVQPYREPIKLPGMIGS